MSRSSLARKQKTNRFNPLVAAATGTFGVAVSATVLNLVGGVLLARLLGSAAYGAYTYAIAWVDLLSVPAIFGLDKLLIRNLAMYKVQSAWDSMNGLLRWANRTVVVTSLGLVLLTTTVTAGLMRHLNLPELSIIWAALFLLPLLALMHLRKATLQGLQHVVTGQLPEMIIRPLVFITLLAGAYLVLNEGLNEYRAVGINAVAVVVALLSGVYLVRNALPQAMKDANNAYQLRLWASSAVPLMFISGLSVANSKVDILLLGVLKDTEAVGVYNVACRAIQLVTFALMIVNVVLAPTISTLYTEGNMKGLQRVITRSSRVVLLTSMAIVAGLIAYGDRLLWLFGADFMRGYTAVIILAIGQLVNAASGSVGQILIMTGHEHAAAMRVGISLVLNIVLNVALIPRWGLEGAAAATALSTIIWNLLLIKYVHGKLGIDSTALGRMSGWR